MSRLHLTFLALLAATAFADANAAGNIEAGKKRAYTCTGCHGIPGYKNTYPMYSVPRIAGQSETYLVNALNAYKSGERKHPTMAAQAQSYSDQDIADIAAYLATAK